MNSFALYPSLKNKGVLITGGATGIGAAFVEHFCAQHSRVIFIDQNAKAAEQLIQTIKKMGHVVPTFYSCDLRDNAALKKIITETNQSSGVIQILINNAGNDQRYPVADITPELWNDILQVNLNHYFFAAQTVQPFMLQAGGGSIINISSNCYLLGQEPNYPGYMTAKAAIMGLTRALGCAFGHQNIRVNCILPGWVMTENQIKKWLTPEAEAELMKTQALKQKIYPADIARMALFLAADDSALCTKQSFVVDGGRA